MQQLASNELEIAKSQLQEIVKPFQQEQSRRQKKSDFLKNAYEAWKRVIFFR